MITAGVLLFATTAAWPAQTFDASPLVFKNIFGSRPGFHTSYSIVGTGMFRAPRADELDAFVASWMKRHPRAVVTVVDQSRLGSKLGEMDYIWINDGADSLNVDLVRQGLVPGGMMADGVDYLSAIKRVARQDMSGPDDPKRLVSDESYLAFMKRIVAAEVAARADKVGLWSDKYREMMVNEGFSSEQDAR